MTCPYCLQRFEPHEAVFRADTTYANLNDLSYQPERDEKLASFLRLNRIGELKRSEELEPWFAGSDEKWRSWEMEIRILAQ